MQLVILCPPPSDLPSTLIIDSSMGRGCGGGGGGGGEDQREVQHKRIHSSEVELITGVALVINAQCGKKN